jgi:hypothetical protein
MHAQTTLLESPPSVTTPDTPANAPAAEHHVPVIRDIAQRLLVYPHQQVEIGFSWAVKIERR